MTFKIANMILRLRGTFGREGRIPIQKVDVKSASPQVGVDPAEVVNFRHVLGDYLFVDQRLQIGYRGSPGWWGVLPLSLIHI